MLAALVLLAATPASAEVERDIFGTLADGRAVERFRLTNARGTSVELIAYGATIARMRLDGTDVVVGPATLAGFGRRRFGGIVGRYAGRLPGSVTIDGKTYPLTTNASGVTLHGGDPGFDRAVWSGKPFATRQATGVVFTYVSRDGEQGFPGTLTITARYALDRRSDTLTLDITARTDRPTVANLTNHVYFNLGGAPTIACHELTVDADRAVALDARKLPTGQIDVDGPLDFRRPRSLAGSEIDAMLMLRRGGRATLDDPSSGRRLTVTTDQPGLQVYAGNGFDGTDRDHAGRAIVRHAGIAIEPGQIPGDPATHIAPGKPLRWSARWSFSRTRARPGCAA